MSSHSLIAKRYAKALFEAALEVKKIDSVDKDMRAISELCQNNQEFYDFTQNPSISRNDQSAVMADIVKKTKPDTLTTNLFSVLADNGRISLLPHVATHTIEMIFSAQSKMNVSVASATKLTATQEKKIIKILQKQTGKTVFVNSHIDETLIGGVVIRYGSNQIDTSIKTKLDIIKRELKGAA